MKERVFFEKILKIIKNIYKDEYSILAFFCCLIAPLLWDFGAIDLIWKIIMIIGTLLSLFVLIFIFIDFTRRDNKKKLLFSYIPLTILFILSVVSYFDFNIFGAKSIIIGLFTVYLIFAGFYNIIKLIFRKTFLTEEFLIILLSLVFVFFWMAMANRTSNNIESASLFLKIGISLSYLIGIHIIIYRYLYSNKQIEIGRKIIGIIFWSGLVIFSLPYFIQWCGVTGESFNIFLAVYTAAIGGGLTLIGVAWTIEKSNKDRKMDAQLSVKPLIYPIAHNSEYNYREQIDIIFYKDSESKERSFIGIIKNTDNGVLIIKEAIVNNEKYGMKFPVVLDKNIPAQIVIFSSNKIKIESMYILGKDILGNDLKYRLIVNSKDIDSIEEL